MSTSSSQQSTLHFVGASGQVEWDPLEEEDLLGFRA